MHCDYPLDNDSILEINLKTFYDFNIVFNQCKWSLLMKMDFGITKNASINTLVVSHNDSVSFSNFANVKHARIPCRQQR